MNTFGLKTTIDNATFSSAILTSLVLSSVERLKGTTLSLKTSFQISRRFEAGPP